VWWIRIDQAHLVPEGTVDVSNAQLYLGSLIRRIDIVGIQNRNCH